MIQEVFQIGKQSLIQSVVSGFFVVSLAMLPVSKYISLLIAVDDTINVSRLLYVGFGIECCGALVQSTK